MKIKEFENSGLNFIEVKSPEITVTFCDLGAAIYSIVFGKKNMLMTPANYADFAKSNLYHGKTIGRTANRIEGDVIEIDGEEFEIAANEDGNTLHGGDDGLSTKKFKYEVKESSTSTKVVFKYTSKDGESGFPGALKVKVTYAIPEKGSKIKVKFEAKTNKPTLCNLTNHAYFTLGEYNNLDLSLKINASNYLLTDRDELLPIEKAPITKELNFLKFKRIGRHLHFRNLTNGKANGYDHNFYLDEVTKKPQIFLKSDDFSLKIRTDFECVQIYSDNYEDDIKWLDVYDGKNRSLAIEPQDDYLNRKVLRPGEKYERYIQYEFKKR